MISAEVTTKLPKTPGTYLFVGTTGITEMNISRFFDLYRPEVVYLEFNSAGLKYRGEHGEFLAPDKLCGAWQKIDTIELADQARVVLTEAYLERVLGVFWAGWGRSWVEAGKGVPTTALLAHLQGGSANPQVVREAQRLLGYAEAYGWIMKGVEAGTWGPPTDVKEPKRGVL